MADKSFGVKELRITGTGTPTIESPGGGNLNLNAATATSVGVVNKVSKGVTTLSLRLPICAPIGSRVTLSRRIDSRWRLIGHGTISG